MCWMWWQLLLSSTISLLCHVEPLVPASCRCHHTESSTRQVPRLKEPWLWPRAAGHFLGLGITSKFSSFEHRALWGTYQKWQSTGSLVPEHVASWGGARQSIKFNKLFQKMEGVPFGHQKAMLGKTERRKFYTIVSKSCMDPTQFLFLFGRQILKDNIPRETLTLFFRN